VTVAEINKTRLERVVQMLGVTPLVEKSDKRFDLVLDATGNAKVMEQSFLHVHHGGRLVFVGVIKAPITFDDALLHAREITLFASRNSHNQFSRIIELIEKKQFDPSLWITHRLALDHVPEQFEATTHNADLIKLVIQVPDELARR
jgi:threonine dehydrogenase-like Zn-dependent dehydrogenase